MKMILLNGSPHAEKGNSAIFAEHFLRGMKRPGPVRCIAREDPAALAAELEDYDSILIVMPLYVHAMPGIVMKLFEHLKPARHSGCSMGFLVQSGFLEAAQSRFLEQYLAAFTNRMGYQYLGCAIRGGAAGTYLMPEKANKALFGLLRSLGAYYEENGTLDESIIKRLGTPYTLTRVRGKWMELLHRLKIGDAFWYLMLQKNKAFRKRKDRPFAEKTG